MVKQSKIITQHSKPIEIPNVADIESVTIGHPKISHELSKTLRQGKKFSQIADAGKTYSSPLYSDTTKRKTLLNEQNSKITKRSHAYKGYASSYILNSFNPELQLKDTEYIVRRF